MNESVIICTFYELNVLYFVVRSLESLFSPVGRTPPHCEKYVIARVGRSWPRALRTRLFYYWGGSAFLIMVECCLSSLLFVSFITFLSSASIDTDLPTLHPDFNFFFFLVPTTTFGKQIGVIIMPTAYPIRNVCPK